MKPTVLPPTPHTAQQSDNIAYLDAVEQVFKSEACALSDTAEGESCTALHDLCLLGYCHALQNQSAVVLVTQLTVRVTLHCMLRVALHVACLTNAPALPSLRATVAQMCGMQCRMSLAVRLWVWVCTIHAGVSAAQSTPDTVEAPCLIYSVSLDAPAANASASNGEETSEQPGEGSAEPQTSSRYAHEAGFDALMAGLAFVALGQQGPGQHGSDQPAQDRGTDPLLGECVSSLCSALCCDCVRADDDCECATVSVRADCALCCDCAHCDGAQNEMVLECLEIGRMRPTCMDSVL